MPLILIATSVLARETEKGELEYSSTRYSRTRVLGIQSSSKRALRARQLCQFEVTNAWAAQNRRHAPRTGERAGAAGARRKSSLPPPAFSRACVLRAAQHDFVDCTRQLR